MQLSLHPELERFIESEIGSGIFQNPGEVIEAALRRLRRERQFALPPQPKTKEELEQQLLAALDRLDRGEGIDGRESRRRFHERVNVRLGNA
jgi:putative addiction module CopG family antidote